MDDKVAAALPSPPPPSPAPRPPSFLRALRHRPFFLLWASQLISQSGDFVFDIALLWLVLETTGSVFAVGLVVTAMLVPAVLLGPVLGVYIDRWPRRPLLIATNVLEGVLVAGLSGLVLDHAAGLDVILAVVVALGAGAQVVRIASSALVPQTVSTDDLAPANSLLSFSGSFNQVVGLSIGGVAVAAFGVALPIEYDALSFFLAAALLLGVPRAVGQPGPTAAGTDPTGFRAQFVEGFAFVRSQRFLIEIILLGMVVNFFGNAINALLAPYAALVLHGGPTTYGSLGAILAVGSIVGAFVAGKVNARRFAGKLLFGGSIASGAVIALLGLTSDVYLALAEMFGLGALLAITNVPMLTLVQAKVPARLMGRSMAVLFSLLVAMGPFGSFFAGSFAAARGVASVFLFAGIAIMVADSVGFAVMSELRNVEY